MEGNKAYYGIFESGLLKNDNFEFPSFVLFLVHLVFFFFLSFFGLRLFCINKMVLKFTNTHLAKISVVFCMFLAFWRSTPK